MSLPINWQDSPATPNTVHASDLNAIAAAVNTSMTFDLFATQGDTVAPSGVDLTTVTSLLEIAAANVLEIPATSSVEIPFGASSIQVNPTLTGFFESAQFLGTVGAITVVLSLAKGTLINATLTASTTTIFVMPPPVMGQSFSLLIKQAAATGSGAVTFVGVKWAAIGAPTITTTPGAADLLSFICPDGINWYGACSQGYTY